MGTQEPSFSFGMGWTAPNLTRALVGVQPTPLKNLKVSCQIFQTWARSNHKNILRHLSGAPEFTKLPGFKAQLHLSLVAYPGVNDLCPGFLNYNTGMIVPALSLLKSKCKHLEKYLAHNNCSMNYLLVVAVIIKYFQMLNIIWFLHANTSGKSGQASKSFQHTKIQIKGFLSKP